MGEREDNNPIQEYPEPGLRDIIKEWYVESGTVAAKSLEQRGIDTRAEREFADLSSRQQKLEDVEKADMSKLEQLQAKIEAFASAVGVQFDPKTGEVYFGAKRDPNAPVPRLEEMTETGDELSRISREHSAATQELYGDGLNDSNADPEKSKNPGIVELVTQQKMAIMKRDLSIGKLQQERVRFEAAKDRMDMHGARHVAEKNRLMMMIEQLRFELIKEMAGPNASPDNLTIQNLRGQIEGLTNQVVGLENQFKNEHASYAKEYDAAMVGLQGAAEVVEYDQTFLVDGQEKAMRDIGGKNQYSKKLLYSNGIFSGTVIEGTKDGYAFGERKMFDQGKLMVDNILQPKTTESSIRFGGQVVSIITEYDSANRMETSYYMGNVEKLETNVAAGEVDSEQKIDIAKQQDNAHVGNLNPMSVVDEFVVRFGYKYAKMNEEEYTYIDYKNPDMLAVLGPALSAFGGPEAMILSTIENLVNDKIVEMIRAEKEKEKDGFEIQHPSEKTSNY